MAEELVDTAESELVLMTIGSGAELNGGGPRAVVSLVEAVSGMTSGCGGTGGG